MRDRAEPSSRPTGIRLGEAVRILGAACLVLVPLNCARPGRPPGGPQDRLPPQVVRTTPDTFEVLSEGIESIKLEFNERISERALSGTMDQTVLVSPQTGAIEVKPGRSSIEVKMEGGFRVGFVYRITVLPEIQDMFQNSMADAFEFVFSIGSTIEDGVIAGEVFDRITGQPVSGVRVVGKQGVPEDSTDPGYVAVTDSSGIYAFRYMPPGDWRLEAFTDQNRNGAADFAEPVGHATQTLGLNDTTFVSLTMLRPDTTAARVLSIEVVDSLTLKASFDDYLAEDTPINAVEIKIESDSLVPPRSARILRSSEYDLRARRLEVLARLAEDTTAAPGPPQPPIDSLVPDTVTARPSQAMYFLLADTLATEVPYAVVLAGITNINGIPDGGGADTIVRPAPPPPDTTQSDSTGVDTTTVDTVSVDTTPEDTTPEDTTLVDTTAVDTTAVDTTAVDTASVDTTGSARPDTGGVARRTRLRLLRRLRR